VTQLAASSWSSSTRRCRPVSARLTIQVAFVCAGEWVLAGPGSFVYGPREIPHGFQVVGAVNARMLLMGLPGGFDKFVMELATPVDVPPSPPDLGHLVAVAAKYGIDIHGPLPEMPASITSA
jgi:hypothetical protein